VRFFVIAPDGGRFGPADIPTLNHWIAEGRLLPSQVLEDEANGARLSANLIPGLVFNLRAPDAPPVNFGPGPLKQPVAYASPYLRPGFADLDDGREEVRQAWQYAIIGFFCWPPFFFKAFAACKSAEAKGNRNTKGPRILATILLVGTCIMTLTFIKSLTSAMSDVSKIPGISGGLNPG